MGVSCHLMSAGVALEAVEIPLEANGQTAWFIEDVFTTTDTSDFVGAVRCTAPGRGRFTAIAVEMDAAGGIFTPVPVVEVNRVRAEATTLDFAHFANGAGIVSEMVFVNRSTRPSGPGPTPYHATTSPSRPTLYFYDQEGQPIDPVAGINRQYKTKYRIRNWREYERGLRSRGDVTIWLSEDAITAWIPPKNGLRGGQRRYSNLAIRTALTLRVVFGLPLRQTEGFLDSLLSLMSRDLKAPDHTTLSRRNQIVVVPANSAMITRARSGTVAPSRFPPNGRGVKSGCTLGVSFAAPKSISMGKSRVATTE